MSSEQTCICLTHPVYAKCENGCVNEEATIDYYHGYALKLRNTCRRSLSPRLVRWSCPVVPKVWVKTQRRVEKGHKMGRTEVIQTRVMY